MSVAENNEEITHLQESRRQPVWHVIVLYILTLSMYWPFWFAKNWSLLIHAQKNAAGEEKDDERLVPYIAGGPTLTIKSDPILLTIGMFVPILNLVLAFRLFKQITSIYPAKDQFPAQRPAVAAALLLAAMIALFGLGWLPSTLFLFCLTSVAPLALAQHWLNQYWKQHEPPGSLVRQAFSSIELVAVIIGSLWLGLIVIGPFLVPK